MSKHIDGVVSEKIVRSDHSTRGHPETIQEIKRILYERAKALTAVQDNASTLNR